MNFMIMKQLTGIITTRAKIKLITLSMLQGSLAMERSIQIIQYANDDHVDDQPQHSPNNNASQEWASTDQCDLIPHTVGSEPVYESIAKDVSRWTIVDKPDVPDSPC